MPLPGFPPQTDTFATPGTSPKGWAPLRATRFRALVSAVTIGVLLVLPACTTFHPLAADPTPGEQIRARLTAEGQMRQASATGVARMSLEGSVIAVEPNALVLQVPIPGIVPELQRSLKVADTLRVPRADVTGMDVQRFSAARSGLLAGGVIAVAVLGIALAGHIGSSDGGTSDPTNRNALRPTFPIVRIPIGR